MDEAFDCWSQRKSPMTIPVFHPMAQTDLQALVRRDRNHPSVIMWSVGTNPQSTTATATNLKNWVLAVDSTRPVTWASVDTSNANNQAVAAVLDLQGYNYSSGATTKTTQPMRLGSSLAVKRRRLCAAAESTRPRLQEYPNTTDSNKGVVRRCSRACAPGGPIDRGL